MARSPRPDFGEKKPFKFTIDVDDAFSFLDDFKQSPNYPKTGAELGLNFPYTPNKYQILGDMLRGTFGIDTVEARKIVGMWFERNNRIRTESKRKIITLTESDLLRIVKRVIKENEENTIYIPTVYSGIITELGENVRPQEIINLYNEVVEEGPALVSYSEYATEGMFYDEDNDEYSVNEILSTLNLAIIGEDYYGLFNDYDEEDY
jgi:hypothetical protein